MTVATLWNTPKTPESLAQFSFANQDSHNRIIAAIAAQKSLTLPIGIVDPVPLFSMGVWAYSHQSMHNDFNNALGLAGNDLTDVDFNDPSQVEAWVSLHAKEHVAAENALGIG